MNDELLKRLVSIWKLLATKTQLSEFVQPQDIVVLERRALAEGLPFLTVTLPRLFKALDRGLSTFCLEEIEGFKVKKGCAYPLMLVKAWETLFTEEGILRPEARLRSPSRDDWSVELHSSLSGAVACIRQLSAVFYKLELPYTEKQEQVALDAFRSAEDDLSQLDLSNPANSRVLERARRILERLLAGSDPLEILPKHGGGSSSCRVKPWLRYSSFRYIPRLSEVFPQDEYFFANPQHLCDMLDEWISAKGCEPMARVVFVPKDSRGPRLISCEPREFMYIQQGLWAKLDGVVKRKPAIAGQVGFTDQTRNQRMAYEGSMDPDRYATLDLKEASDRISVDLVARLFPPHWSSALLASRSLGTELPDGTVKVLHKFAPMGSACCFPILALCVWSIALAATEPDSAYINRLFTDRLRPNRDLAISVFGDDIIVPTAEVPRVIQALEAVGLLTNRDKSYWSGSFRESCGGDFFQGVDCTPVRVKALPENDNVSANRTCNVLNNIAAKYDTGVLTYDIQDLFCSWYGPWPVSNNFRARKGSEVERDEFGDRITLERLHDGITLYGRYVDVPPRIKRRWNKSLQKLEYRCLVTRPFDIEVETDDWGHVLRKQLGKLQPWTANTAALAKRVRIKHSWTAL